MPYLNQLVLNVLSINVLISNYTAFAENANDISSLTTLKPNPSTSSVDQREPIKLRPLPRINFRKHKKVNNSIKHVDLSFFTTPTMLTTNFESLTTNDKSLTTIDESLAANDESLTTNFETLTTHYKLLTTTDDLLTTIDKSLTTNYEPKILSFTSPKPKRDNQFAHNNIDREHLATLAPRANNFDFTIGWTPSLAPTVLAPGVNDTKNDEQKFFFTIGHGETSLRNENTTLPVTSTFSGQLSKIFFFFTIIIQK